MSTIGSDISLSTLLKRDTHGLLFRQSRKKYDN